MHKALVFIQFAAMGATVTWAERLPVSQQERQGVQAMSLDIRRQQQAACQYPGTTAVYSGDEQGLWALMRLVAQTEGSGAVVDASKVPLLKLTVRLAREQGVSPYEADCRGCLIAVTLDGAGLAGQLCAQGIPAAVIGRLTGRPGPVLVQQGGEIRTL